MGGEVDRDHDSTLKEKLSCHMKCAIIGATYRTSQSALSFAGE